MPSIVAPSIVRPGRLISRLPDTVKRPVILIGPAALPPRPGRTRPASTTRRGYNATGAHDGRRGEGEGEGGGPGAGAGAGGDAGAGDLGAGAGVESETFAGGLAVPGDVGVAGGTRSDPPSPRPDHGRAAGDAVNASARITAMTRFPGAIRSTSTM